MANLSDIITPTNVVTDTSTSTLTNKTLTAPVLTNATGSLSSPVLTTPNLGTPSALVLTNATGTLTSPTFVTPALGTPASGVMTSVTGLPLTTGVTGTLPVANGGTGATSLTANNVLLGNGTSAPQAVAPSTAGNILTSDGSTWASTAPAAGGPTAGYWVLLKTVTASTGVNSWDLTNCMSSTYETYLIEGNLDYGNVVSESNFVLRAYDGSTLKTTAYTYGVGGREGTTAWSNSNNVAYVSMTGGSSDGYATIGLQTYIKRVSSPAGLNGVFTASGQIAFGSPNGRGAFFTGGNYITNLTGVKIYDLGASATRTGTLKVWGFKES
jgi:hypothetical protein